MNDTWNLIAALLAGASLGAMFFGGLWWTVCKGISSKHPALWFPGSLLLRTSIVLAGRGSWERMLACLFGFYIARVIVARLTRAAEKPANWVREASHAP